VVPACIASVGGTPFVVVVLMVSRSCSMVCRANRESMTLGVPVVFLVLPVTVLFAVYPGISLLRFAV
jgi:hypothetical protein